MNSMKKDLLRFFFLILAFSTSFTSVFSIDTPSFVVALDAGHGGHDPGAVGAKSYEKQINLGVILALGDLISKNNPDVKVVYTRKTDVYLTLQERADVANSAHADLFISVHTNANNNKTASGSETYTLGLTKSKSNLDVAMRENSVILLEDDYKVKYEGFNPKSVDSYIMFECIQDKYLDKSVQIASQIQKNFVSAGRKDRGVRQAGFWVLHKTAMPSVLVELGYISNPEEEKFLASNEGQQKMASAIYDSFDKFKKEYERKSGTQNYKNSEPETEAIAELKPVKEEKQSKSKKQKEEKLAKEKAEAEKIKAEEAEAARLQAEMAQAMAQAEARKKEAEKASEEPVKTGTYSVISASRRTIEPEKTKMVIVGEDGQTQEVSNVVITQTPAKKETVNPVAVKTKTSKTEPAKAKVAKEVVPENEEVKTETEAEQTDDIVYKIQLFAVSKVLPSNSPKLKGLNAPFYQEGGLFKYTYGASSNYSEILKIQKQIASKFPQTIIVVFRNGKKVPLTDVRK